MVVIAGIHALVLALAVTPRGATGGCSGGS